jgi:hypothetical protein
MTSIEQHKIIQTLAEYAHKLRGRERDEFDMMVKRDKDDEELDEITRRKLLELYHTHVPERFR